MSRSPGRWRRRAAAAASPRGAAAVGAVLVGAALLARRAAWTEPRALELPEHEIALPGWPAELDGLRVAVVADLHAGGAHVRERRLAAVVDAVNAAAPDLVALVGDYVDTGVAGARRVPPAVVASTLARLRAPAGVVAVLGNHDWVHEGRLMGEALRDAGLTVLENAAVRREWRGAPLWVAGLADPVEREARVDQALATVPAGAPVLLLAHNPDVFPRVPRSVALTIAGHTHGAQVDVPLLRRRIIPSRYGARYRAGAIVEDGRTLFVSRGIGSTGAPVRFNAPPEAPVLRLVSA